MNEVPYCELPVLGVRIQNLVARATCSLGFEHPSPSDDLENVTIGARKVSNHAVEEGIGDGTHVFEVTLTVCFHELVNSFLLNRLTRLACNLTSPMIRA